MSDISVNSEAIAALVDGGISPYPNGDLLKKLLAQMAKIVVPFSFDAVEYAAGASKYVVSPVAADVAKLVVVVDAATTGIGTHTVEIDGTPVTAMSIAVADSTAAGTVASDTVDAGATTRVAAGAAVEIITDGTPTAGAVSGYIELIPA